MARPSCLLVALLPPGSVESEVGRVQEQLFAEHGLVSAMAVPPLIPVAFLPDGETPAKTVQGLDRSVPDGWRIRVSGSEWVQGHLFARAQSGGAWPMLRAAADTAARACADPGTGLFPVFEGFYLGCAEASEETRSAILPRIPILSFSSAALAVLRIETTGSREWWQELHWEIIDQRRLRGRRES